MLSIAATIILSTENKVLCKLSFVNYGERLDYAIKLAKSSRAAVAEATGRSVQAIGQVIRGDTGALTAENSARAARALGVNHFWLATGEGSAMSSADCPLSQELIDELAKLPHEQIVKHENSLRIHLGMETISQASLAQKRA